MNDKNNINNPNAIKLKKNFEKIKILEDKLRECNNSYKIFKNKIKTEPILYKEYRKKINEFRNNRCKLRSKIEIERYILINNNYIIPLIVPTPVNIH